MSCDDEERSGLWRVEYQDGPIWVPRTEHVSAVSVSAYENWTFPGTFFGRVRMWNNGQDASGFWKREMISHWHREYILLKDAVDFAVSREGGDLIFLDKTTLYGCFARKIISRKFSSVPGTIISGVAISTWDKTLWAFGLKEGNIYLWDRGQNVEHWEPLAGYTDEVSCLAYCPSWEQNRFVSGSKDNFVRVRDIATRKKFRNPWWATRIVCAMLR